MDLMSEIRAADEEYRQAQAQVEEMQSKVDSARSAYSEALAVKSTGEADLEAVTQSLAQSLHELNLGQKPRVHDYLLEYHANIGCYHGYLFLSVGEYNQLGTSNLHVEYEDGTVQIDYGDASDSQSSVVWTAQVAKEVDVPNASIQVQADHLYVRLPVTPEAKEQHVGGSSSFSQTSLQELEPSNYASVGCKYCSHSIVSSCDMEKALPMPSANWMDMFDFWGVGLGSFEHLPHDGIQAKANRVFVSESFVLLHASHAAADAFYASIQPSESTEEKQEDWTPLSCGQCGVSLGLQQRDTLCLYKYRITASKQDGQTDVFAKYTVDSVVTAKLLELADSDGVFSFDLQQQASKAAEDVALRLQLLSWETTLKTHEMDAFQRVLKVAFVETAKKPLSNGEESKLTAAATSAKTLELSSEVCGAVRRRLAVSSTLLPASLRSFNRMNVGYLFA